MRRKSIIDAVQGRRARIERRAPSAEDAPRPNRKQRLSAPFEQKFGRAIRFTEYSRQVYSTPRARALRQSVPRQVLIICSPPRCEQVGASDGGAAAAPLLGLALQECYGSIVAEIVEIATAGGKPAPIERVACAIDCRVIVHPAAVVAQNGGRSRHGPLGSLARRCPRPVCALRAAPRCSASSCQCRAAWRRAPTPSRVTSIS